MGRKPPPEKLYKRAQANGYRYGAHHTEDSKIVNTRYVPKTIRDQDSVIDRYEIWVASVQKEKQDKMESLPNDETIEVLSSSPPSLRAGVPCLDLITMKDFFRFYALSSDGRLKSQMTAESLNSQAERFFAGFTRVTGNEVTEQDRSHIYNWVRHTLLKDGHVVNKRKEKHLFGSKEMIEFNRTFWTMDEDHFTHPRNKIQIPFLMSVYCWTGARIGTFFPSKDKPDACLRYRDIQLVLLRVPDGGWKIIYNLSERWVKNNRDPENIVYKCSTSQHEKLLHDDTQYLLAMALADGALYGIDSFKDLWDIRIPDGDDALQLRWKDEVMQLPIVRNAIMARGVTTAPLPKATFEKILKSVLKMSGYFGTATVHAIRRALGKKLDESYTEVQRSQHINQSDPRVYGQSYVANTSSVDGRRRFAEEESQHDHIDYFQGFSQFREKGLPTELPAEEKVRIMREPQLLDLQKRIRALRDESASDIDIKSATNEARNYKTRVMKERLTEFQLEWVRKRRDWKIDTRGKGCAEDEAKPDLENALSRMMPERSRLARTMLSDRPTTEEERKQCVADLCSLISQDSATFSLPGERVINGRCPVNTCEATISNLPKRQQSMHVHTCRRQEIAQKLERMQSELVYCYDCFDWFVGEDWDTHCLAHLKSLSSKRCASIMYCNVLLRPSFCPFCMSDERLRPSSQWQSWTKEAKLWSHLTAHVTACCWPLKCPHPLCSLQFDDELSFLYHLDDVHGLRMSPQMRKSWSTRRDSKSLINWVIPDLTHQKRNRPDQKEEELLPAKRRALQVQLGTEERYSQSYSLNHEDSDAMQKPPYNVLSDSSSDTAFDDDTTPEMTCSNSKSFSNMDAFQSIDDFCTDESSIQTELPDLCELFEVPSIAQLNRKEAPPLTEETLFSQYLRSPSPTYSDKPITSSNVEDNSLLHQLNPADVCFLPEDTSLTESLRVDRNDSEGDCKFSTKPHISLRLNPPKPAPKTKLTLRLNQPKRSRGRPSAFKNTESRQRLHGQNEARQATFK